MSQAPLPCQYESWAVPLAVILSLPVAGVGAYLGIALCGLGRSMACPVLYPRAASPLIVAELNILNRLTVPGPAV